MNKLLILSILALVGCGKDVSKPNSGNQVPTAVNHVFINKTLPNNGNVSDKFVVTPDSTKVVYISDEDMDGKDELFVANVDGTNRKKISLPLDMGENVISFKVAPNSLKVAYTADPTPGFVHLYTVNLDGTEQAQVNNGFPTSAYKIGHYMWTPNSSKIAYTTDEAASVGNLGLFIANPDGTNKLTLNSGPVGEIFDIAANGSRVVYRAGTLNPTLRSIAPNGTGDILLNTPFNLGLNPASSVSSFVISPNSSMVVFRTNQDDASKYELVVVNIDGSGTRTKVSGLMVAGGNVAVTPKDSYNFTADSNNIVYIADQQVDNVQELFISSLIGANTKLSGTMVTNGDLQSFKIIGSKILFLADKEINNVNELYSVDFDGMNLIKINSSLIAGENVAQYASNGTVVSYLMDKASSGVFSVYSNNFSGDDELELVNINGGVGAYDTTAAYAEQILIKDGMVFFRAALTGSTYTLYAVPANGGSLNVVSNEALSGSVILSNSSLGSSFIVTPNGVRAIYRMALPDGNNLISSLVAE